MTVTTTIPGPSYDLEINGWYAYISDGGYTDAQAETLAEALLHEEMNEFNALLPDGWSWHPTVSEIVFPFSQRRIVQIDFDELLQQASAAVIARFEEIEAKALGSVGEA